MGMLGKLDDSIEIIGPVTVRRLIEILEQFDQDMLLELGAEGVFQGPPTGIDVQIVRSGEIAAVIWAT